MNAILSCYFLTVLPWILSAGGFSIRQPLTDGGQSTLTVSFNTGFQFPMSLPPNPNSLIAFNVLFKAFRNNFCGWGVEQYMINCIVLSRIKKGGTLYEPHCKQIPTAYCSPILHLSPLDQSLIGTSHEASHIVFSPRWTGGNFKHPLRASHQSQSINQSVGQFTWFSLDDKQSRFLAITWVIGPVNRKFPKWFPKNSYSYFRSSWSWL